MLFSHGSTSPSKPRTSRLASLLVLMQNTLVSSFLLLLYRCSTLLCQTGNRLSSTLQMLSLSTYVFPRVKYFELIRYSERRCHNRRDQRRTKRKEQQRSRHCHRILRHWFSERQQEGAHRIPNVSVSCLRKTDELTMSDRA